jgi:hypothetical protein
MRQSDQNMLLNLLETGVLTYTKVKKTAEMRFDGIKLFATSNDIDVLNKPLRSRLSVIGTRGIQYQYGDKIIGELRGVLTAFSGDAGAFQVWSTAATYVF